jgi:hypothetical protein
MNCWHSSAIVIKEATRNGERAYFVPEILRKKIAGSCRYFYSASRSVYKMILLRVSGGFFGRGPEFLLTFLLNR